MSSSPALPDDFVATVERIKAEIRGARVKAALAVNGELILLYHRIGRIILERQAQTGWGGKVIERLAGELRREFPDMRGLSRSNLHYMRQFAEAWCDERIVQQAVGQIPWGHNIELLSKLDNAETRLFYAQRVMEHGWSRAILVAQIDTRLHERSGKALTSFERTLPPAQSDLAQQILNDPQDLSFLDLVSGHSERQLETALIGQLEQFVRELGHGFAFLGRQQHLEVGGDDFYIDLLFYHVKLHCYVVVELKTGSFTHGDAGQLGFYVEAVEQQRRDHDTDQPTIGILLCQGKNPAVAEMALNTTRHPLTVIEYRLQDQQAELPATDEVIAALEHLEEPPLPVVEAESSP